MARLLFEMQGIRARRGALATGTVFIVYSDSAGTVLADISATSEASATSAATVAAETSTVTAADIAGLGLAALKFYGPDDVDTLWLGVPSDLALGVQEIEAATDPRLDALEAGGGGSHPNLATHDALGLATDAELTTHAADTTAVHGITDTSVLATTSGVASSIITHAAAADPHADRAYARAYADSVAQGLDVKLSVRVASTANLTLSGEQTIDGVLTSADRVLVKNNTLGATNGIYVSAAGAWSRATDADISAELSPGSFTFVEEGTVNGGTGWVQATPDPVVLDTTPLVFTQFSGGGTIIGGAGLLKTGSTLDVGAGTGITVAADTVGIASGGVTNTQVSASAGIAESKLALNFPTHAADHASRHAAAGADPLTGYVLTGDHTAAAHDTFGLATDAELTTHEADTTSIHGIADTAQVALRNAANTFTADQLFKSGRPWIDVRSYGTNTAAIDAAGAAAFAAGVPLYFSAGSYSYSGSGLTPSGVFAIIGAGTSLVDIQLGAGCYLLKPTAEIFECYVAGFTTNFGKGLFHHSYTGVAVNCHYIFERLRVINFTECAFSNNASDMPYFRFVDVQVQGADSENTIGFAVSGLLNCTTFERCTVLLTRIGVKMRPGCSVYLDKMEFINFDTPGGDPRVRVWIVPTPTIVNSGQGTVIETTEFGNENVEADDIDVLIADEDTGAGSDNATYMPKLGADSTGYMTGLKITKCRVAQDTGVGRRPLVYSTTPNVLGLSVRDNYFDGPPSYLLQFRTAPVNDRLAATGQFGPNQGYDAATEVAGIPISNAPFAGMVNDPFGQYDQSQGKGYTALPGGQDPIGYVNLLTTKIRSFSNPFTLTLTNVTDALGGADATEVTYTSATTITASPAVTPTSGKPAFIEFDLKAGSSSALAKLNFSLEDFSSGKILLRRVVSAPAAGWARYRFPLIFGTGTATMFMQFFTDTGLSGKIQIGRVRVYHAAEPLNVDGVFPNGVVTGLATLATAATDGFLYIPTVTTTPTGVPVAKPGQVPLVWDSSNHKLYVYSGGAWKGGTVPGVFS